MPANNFEIKNKLQIKGIQVAGPLMSDSVGLIDSALSVSALFGGTGATTAPTAGQVLYSSAGTTYAPTTLSSLIQAANYQSISANTTLVAGKRYFVTSASALTLTLPLSPTLNDQIDILDASGNAVTYNITIGRNSSLINGNAGNFIIDANGYWASLIYTGATYGWKVG